MKFFRASTLLSIGVAILLVVGALSAFPTGAVAETGDAVSRGYVSADTGLVPCDGIDCQACHIVSLIQRLINFLIGLSIPIVILLFAWAGILLFTGGDNSERLSTAKKIFQSAIIGFVIALGSYLIIETILHAILNPEYFNGWNSVKCVVDNEATRPKQKNLGDLLREVLGSPQEPVSIGTSGGGGSTSGGGVVLSYGPDGTPVEIDFASDRPVADMGKTYLNVQAAYGSYIQSACSGYARELPNCQEVVSAVIVAESSGDPTAYNETSGAKGLMQIYPGSGANCASTNYSCQINEGVRILYNNYTQFDNNLPNAFAAYNSGNSTTPGQSVSGKNSAMVASTDCQGRYAWQCPINPGGLVETQNYVADICALLNYQKVGC